MAWKGTIMADKTPRVLRQLIVRMAVAMAIAGGIAAIALLRMDNTYRARTLLVMAQMPFEQRDEVPANLADSTEPARRVNYLRVSMINRFPMPDYKTLLTSEDIVAHLRDLMVKRYQELGIAPGKLTLEKMQGLLDVRHKVFIQTPQDIRYQAVVELYVTAKDPRVAAEVANEWAKIGPELTMRTRKSAAEGALDFVQGRYDEIASQLTEVRQQREALDRQWNLDAMKERLAQLEGARTDRQLQQVEAKANIARLELQPKDAAKPADDTQASVPELQARLESLNKELVELEPLIAAQRADTARLETQRAEVDLKTKTLEREADEMSVSLNATKLSVAEMLNIFKVASEARPPEEKAGPQRTLILAVVVFLAGLMVPAHLLGMIALRRYAHMLED
jgi:hypothetical protein